MLVSFYSSFYCFLDYLVVTVVSHIDSTINREDALYMVFLNRKIFKIKDFGPIVEQFKTVL